jgi:hypothetical protein
MPREWHRLLVVSRFKVLIVGWIALIVAVPSVCAAQIGPSLGKIGAGSFHAAIPLAAEEFSDFVGIRHARSAASGFDDAVVDARFQGLAEIRHHVAGVGNQHDGAAALVEFDLG